MEIQDGRYSYGLYKKMSGCPLYIHNTKKACFVRLRGCPYAPIHSDSHMFDAPYVWMPLMFGWLPVSLDAPHMPPCMFGHPHTFWCPPMFRCPIYAWTSPYVWMPLICLDDVWMPHVHTQHKESMLYQTRDVHMPPVHSQHKLSMLCQTKGCPYAPIHLDTPCAAICLDAPPVCLNAPICLDALICLDGPLYVWMPPYVWMSLHVWVPPVWTPLCMVRCPHMFGHPTVCLAYVWLFPVCLDPPNIWGIQRYEGHPNIWECPNIQGTSKCMGGIWTHPKSDKACFLFDVYVQQASKHLPNKHRGIQIYEGVQTYGGIQT